ncbi:Gfo/Idh/MocA family oxidoreductase (plasmid) [Halorussus salilacus]|nr:Gfo/Idh/MocA family oxidoreductase [Halorussus salilacus]
MHHNCYPDGVEVGAVVEKESKKTPEGIPMYEEIEAASDANFDVIDIAVPTDLHHIVFEKVSQTFPSKPIIVEKPICIPNVIEQIERLVEAHSHNVYVNESYRSSKIVEKIIELCDIYDVSSPDISISFCKNRYIDNLSGRYVDRYWGVWGYEGPHIIAILSQLTGIDPLQWEVENSMESSFQISAMDRPTQGFAQANLSSGEIDAHLYTSTNGLLSDGSFINPTSEDRLRVAEITDDEVTITGEFEPIPGMERPKGRVTVESAGERREWVIYDDSLSRHLHRIIADKETMGGRQEISVEKGLDVLRLLRSIRE